MVLVRCPRCQAGFDAQPGTLARCPKCDYAGGKVPAPAHRPPSTESGLGMAPSSQPTTRPQEQTTNGFAVASLVCGIAGIVLAAFTAGLLGVAGLVLGIVALNQIQQTGQQGRGMAIAGIVLGSIGVAILIMGLMFFSMMGMWF